MCARGSLPAAGPGLTQTGSPASVGAHWQAPVWGQTAPVLAAPRRRGAATQARCVVWRAPHGRRRRPRVVVGGWAPVRQWRSTAACLGGRGCWPTRSNVWGGLVVPPLLLETRVCLPHPPCATPRCGAHAQCQTGTGGGHGLTGSAGAAAAPLPQHASRFAPLWFVDARAYALACNERPHVMVAGCAARPLWPLVCDLARRSKPRWHRGCGGACSPLRPRVLHLRRLPAPSAARVAAPRRAAAATTRAATAPVPAAARRRCGARRGGCCPTPVTRRARVPAPRAAARRRLPPAAAASADRPPVVAAAGVRRPPPAAAVVAAAPGGAPPDWGGRRGAFPGRRRNGGPVGRRDGAPVATVVASGDPAPSVVRAAQGLLRLRLRLAAGVDGGTGVCARPAVGGGVPL